MGQDRWWTAQICRQPVMWPLSGPFQPIVRTSQPGYTVFWHGDDISGRDGRPPPRGARLLALRITSAYSNCSVQQLQRKIAAENCSKLQRKIAANCSAKLQRKIAAQNCSELRRRARIACTDQNHARATRARPSAAYRGSSTAYRRF